MPGLEHGFGSNSVTTQKHVDRLLRRIPNLLLLRRSTQQCGHLQVGVDQRGELAGGEVAGPGMWRRP